MLKYVSKALRYITLKNFALSFLVAIFAET